MTVNPSIWIKVPKMSKKLSPILNMDQIDKEYSKYILADVCIPTPTFICYLSEAKEELMKMTYNGSIPKSSKQFCPKFD